MTIQRLSAPVRVGMPMPAHRALIVREQLGIGDRVRTLHAGRAGTVMKVYPDGSACITWDDKPAPLCLGHERMPRSLLIVLGSSVTESEGGEAGVTLLTHLPCCSGTLKPA